MSVGDASRFRRELAADPALVARILATLPPVPAREVITIRTDRASTDAAIRKALVLAVKGIDARLELTQ